MAEAKGLIQNVGQWPARVKNYVQELQNEMKRVTWPSRKQVESTTIVVIVTVFAFAAYFAVVDTLFSRTIGKLFQMFTMQ